MQWKSWWWCVAALVLGVGALLRGSTAAGRASTGFDGTRALKLIEKQVGFGPRVPGMAGHRACLAFMEETLKPLAGRVRRQSFSPRIDGRTLPMTNLIAEWNGKGSPARDGILLAAHWDTRPTADYEFSPQARATPISGANDGGSGVAVLLEVARELGRQPPPVPVTMVFFDGEDVGPDIDRMFYGSKHFAANLPENTPRRGILLDMIGDRNLEVPQEAHSVREAGDVVNEVYAVAKRLGLQKQFPARINGAIEDDHVPLHRKGLRVIDLIDFDYGPGHSWWHTLADTPDKCSAASLQAVGDLVLTYLRDQKPH